MIGSHTEIYAVLGWPVRHSCSPAMHNAAFAALGRDAVYVACEVSPECLGPAVSGAAALGLRGLNLTVPHKEAVVPWCHRLSDEARRVGAVNTLSFEEDGVVGHNTDAPGFLRALRTELGIDPPATRALVLGAGGVARAVVTALGDAGARHLAIAARTADRARDLLAAVGRGPGRVVAWEATAIADALGRADLVVSCLPPAAIPPGLDALGPSTAVFDVTYTARTALLVAAERAGARTADGVELLVQQGALALELWTGGAAPVAAMRAAVRAARRPKEPGTER